MTNIQAAEKRLQEFIQKCPVENQVPVVDPKMFNHLVQEIVICARCGDQDTPF